MKQIYESFSELADEVCAGDKILHNRFCPGPDECIAWQKGVRDLGRVLDKLGIAIPQTTDIADRLWARE